jgi:hypothetical protein
MIYVVYFHVDSCLPALIVLLQILPVIVLYSIAENGKMFCE